MAIELLGDTCPPLPNRVHAQIADHPQMPERSMVTIPGHPRECNGPFAPPHGVPNCVAIELLGDTNPPRPNRVHARVGNHPEMPERSMVTIPRASARVQRTCCTTPWCPQVRGHRTIGRHKSTPPQPRACAGWRPPANAREIDGDHSRASARVQRACCTTPGRPQLRGHRTFGRHKSIPFQRRVCAGWRPPGNAREIDGGHPQGIRASAADLLRHAMLSPSAWPSNYWATQVHPTPTACMRGLATTRKCQRARW